MLKSVSSMREHSISAEWFDRNTKFQKPCGLAHMSPALGEFKKKKKIRCRLWGLTSIEKLLFYFYFVVSVPWQHWLSCCVLWGQDWWRKRARSIGWRWRRDAQFMLYLVPRPEEKTDPTGRGHKPSCLLFDISAQKRPVYPSYHCNKRDNLANAEGSIVYRAAFSKNITSLKPP